MNRSLHSTLDEGSTTVRNLLTAEQFSVLRDQVRGAGIPKRQTFEFLFTCGIGLFPDAETQRRSAVHMYFCPSRIVRGAEVTTCTSVTDFREIGDDVYVSNPSSLIRSLAGRSGMAQIPGFVTLLDSTTVLLDPCPRLVKVLRISRRKTDLITRESGARLSQQLIAPFIAG